MLGTHDEAVEETERKTTSIVFTSSFPQPQNWMVSDQHSSKAGTMCAEFE